MDALTRYHRMKGAAPCGNPARIMPASPPRWWSSASSRRKNKTRHDLGREKFTERVWAWKEESGGTDHPAAAAHGRIGGLGAGALHHGRRPVRARFRKFSCSCTRKA